MNLSQPRQAWVQFGILTGMAVLFYELGFLAFFFLVPIQILYSRHGEVKGGLSSLATGVMVILLGIVRSADLTDGNIRWLLLGIEGFTLAVFLGGLFLLNSDALRLKRTLYRLLTAAVVTGVVSAAFFSYLSRNEMIADLFKNLVKQILAMFAGGENESASFGLMGLGSLLTPENVFDGFKIVIFRFFLFFYVLLMAFTVKVSALFTRKKDGSVPYATTGFSVPDWMVWPLLLSWGFILLDVFVSIGFFSYVFWNTGLICLFIYGLQGHGILRYLMIKRNFPRGLQMFLNFMVFLLLLLPGINIIIIFGIPVFGVSEVWIKYRQRKGNTDNESNTHT